MYRIARSDVLSWVKVRRRKCLGLYGAYLSFGLVRPDWIGLGNIRWSLNELT
jgi:hypothetical protein